jgi:uncharacterized protein YlxW (UPF0749 family)
MTVSTADNSLEAPAIDVIARVADAPEPRKRPTDGTWVWQVTALSMVLGVMMALAIRTTVSSARKGQMGTLGMTGALSSSYLRNFKEQSEGLQTEIRELRKKNDEYEKASSSSSETVKQLKKQLEELKVMSGLVPVEGPGLKIILRDSPEPKLPGLTPEAEQGYLIHDQDLYNLFNELKATGAEAIAISGADSKNVQRLVVNSAARCVGPNILVNGMLLPSPYTVYAVGNAKNMRAAIEMRNGLVETRGLKILNMISIEESPHLVLPAYSGNFTPVYARPAAENP